MQGLKSCFPCPALRPYVRAYAQRWTDVTDSAIFQVTPALTEQVLEFEFGYPIRVFFSNGTEYVSTRNDLVGAVTRSDSQSYATGLFLPPGVQSFAVFFQPAGFSHLFGVPMYETTNRAFDASMVAGPCIRALWNILGENPSFERRVEIVEQFLQARISRTFPPGETGSLANYIMQRRGTISMMELATRSGLGLRQFERTFLKQAGCSPKIFARVARFQSALDAKVANPKRTWVELAQDFRYHDQMHMIHDFEKLGGTSPGELLALIGDMRPPALASAAK